MTDGADGERRESAAGVIGVGSGLVILIVLVAALAVFRGGEADPAEVLASISTLAAPPPGLEVERSVRLPFGDRMLLLSVADPAALGIEGAGPERLVLASYRTPDSVAALFRAGSKPDAERRRRWEREPEFAFREGLESGELAWDDWRAPYARDRDYRAGGEFADTVRLNLSREGAPAVLFAIWPDGVDGDEEQLPPILRALALRAD